MGKWPQLIIAKLDNWKDATIDTSKIFVGPVHLLPKTDKWDYLQSPIIEIFFVSWFDIGEVPRSPWKWNWNFLYFLPFISSFERCDLERQISKIESTLECPIVKLTPPIFQALKVHRWRPNSTLNDPSHLCNITSLSACWRPKLWPPLFIMRQNGVKKVWR